MTDFIQVMLDYNDLTWFDKENNQEKHNGFYTYFADIDDKTIRDFIIETRVGKETYETWQPLGKHFFWLAIQYVFGYEDMICVQELEKNQSFMKWLHEHERDNAQKCFNKDLENGLFI